MGGFGLHSRRYVAGLLAVFLVVMGLIVLRAQSASADTQTTTLTALCPLLDPVSVAVSATDTPDPAVAGGPVALSVLSGVPDFGVDDPVTSVAFDLPIPAQVASVDGVTFAGGNMVGSSTVAADHTSVTITFTGPIAASAIVLPTFTIQTTLAAGTGGQTIEWAGPTSITTVFYAVPVTCTAAPTNPAIQSTAVEAAPTTTTTTTTAPTSTTTSTTSTSTTAPTTTTSTTAPTTTTTSSTTTSTTTTTAPTTTTTGVTSTTTTTEPTTTTSTTTSTTTTTTAPTTSTTSTTKPSTTTTAPSTSTTTTSAPSTTTTTRPTSTTTKPSTTTTRPSTTTTRKHPPTTKPHHPDHDHDHGHHHHHHGRDAFRCFLKFQRALACRLFGHC